MFLQEVEVRHIALPLKTPWRTAYGSDTSIHSVLVRLASNGKEGWGEATPFEAPTYSPQTAHCAFYVLKEFFVPALAKLDLQSADDLLNRLVCFKGNTFAKAAIETAWWDLEAELQQLPLWKLLGGTKTSIPVGAAFEIHENIDDLLNKIHAAAETGYPRVKLKVSPGRDLAVVRAVRDAFPDLTMHIDCNSGYDFERDKKLFQKLDAYDLAMIEQPLNYDDLLDHAKLQKLISTPICLDESITSVKRFKAALEMNACQVVNVKPGRVGGLAVAKRIHDMAVDAGITAWVGGMLESEVGASLAAALASLPGFTYPADILPSSRIHQESLAHPGIVLDKSCQLLLGTQPGVQCDVDMDRLNAVTLERFHVSYDTV